MRICVYHNQTTDSAGYCRGDRGYQPFHEMRVAADFRLADAQPARELADTIDVLEHVFELFNIGDDPSMGTPRRVAVSYRARGNRSLSVGDVVQLDNTFYACDRVGWAALDNAPRVAEAATDDNCG